MPPTDFVSYGQWEEDMVDLSFSSVDDLNLLLSDNDFQLYKRSESLHAVLRNELHSVTETNLPSSNLSVTFPLVKEISSSLLQGNSLLNEDFQAMKLPMIVTIPIILLILVILIFSLVRQYSSSFPKIQPASKLLVCSPISISCEEVPSKEDLPTSPLPSFSTFKPLQQENSTDSNSNEEEKNQNSFEENLIMDDNLEDESKEKQMVDCLYEEINPSRLRTNQLKESQMNEEKGEIPIECLYAKVDFKAKRKNSVRTPNTRDKSDFI